ncbi:flagellar basal body rod protein FlgB [Methylobacterium sp. DB0501]|jgi:flagellar basal-body rod protein FlgB|uniref:Flagellar basal body rod protein FlgB n=1 Tax=Methylobacterium currus TaxID=2051553 RepID=A0A2R4WX95_9HYPH|nr:MULTISPECIES: flagellar basal body rod protein FlgB [Methylobacterium]AWB26164.1 flagellar basal body rod protein FlgB [Methylobacterium currus]NGM38605.1 flagellar basal body rod protein FlgB [Methylobacterium sp. DB0501]
MTEVYLFDLASKQARYLAVRQATIAGNVANANTPGYKARDVVPFSQVMAQTHLELAVTASAHTSILASDAPVRTMQSREGWDVLETSSAVSLEQEMLKANDVSRQHNLNIGVTKAFDRMLSLAIRGA